MFCWNPTKEELNHWVESQEKEFAEKQNKSPRLSTKDWLQKHIITDLHAIFLRPLEMSFTTGYQS